jgi:hypothetical protein
MLATALRAGRAPRDWAPPGATCPRCGRRHRTWYAGASCRWRLDLLWAQGDPPAGGPCFAVVSFCGRYAGPHVTVTLWADRAAAQAAKALIDRLACGGRCSGQHYLYAMTPPASAAGEGR